MPHFCPSLKQIVLCPLNQCGYIISGRSQFEGLVYTEMAAKWDDRTPCNIANLYCLTAVYTDTLHVQMGNRNNIYTCDEAHAPRNVDEPWSDAVQRTEATDEQGADGMLIHTQPFTGVSL